MATIIDALVVTLGLDASEFKKGQEQARESLDKTKKDADKTGKEMEIAGKRAASFFGSIRNEILALAGVALTAQGVKNFITGTADSLSKLGYASQTLGMSSKELDGWQKSFSRFGASAEQVRGSMLSLQNDLALFRNKGQLSEGLVSLTGRLGINLQNAKGEFKNVQDIYLELAERFKNMDAATRTMYGHDIGLSPEMVNMLSQGGQSVSQQVKHYTNLSNATEESTKKAQKYEQQLADLAARFDATKQKILVGLMPVLESLNKILGKFSDWVSAHQAEITTFFNELEKDIEKAVEAVGGWGNAIKILIGFSLASWASGLISSIVGVGVALTGMVNSIALRAGGGIIGKAGVAGAAAYLSEPYIDKAMNAAFGKNQWFQNVRTAKDWGEFWDSLNGENHLSKDAQGNWQRLPDKALPRGVRNNNPGNLNYAKQRGATKEEGPNGRFAVFQSMTEGVAALYRQLMMYFQRGTDTIDEIVRKYAPEGDNNNVAAYIQSLVKATGKGDNELLSSDDMTTIFSLMKGIINHENGKGYVSDNDIASGIQLGAGAAWGGTNTRGFGNVQTETNIGNLNIYTQATDAQGIVHDARRELGKNPLIGAMNGGQS